MSSSEPTGRGTNAPVAGASFTSYSLNYEDVILHRLFPQRRYGFYVDVGAGHPRFENDLYALYERGWTGINVEPNEGFFALYEQLRPRDLNLCMLLSDAVGPSLTYYEIEGSGLSTCDEAQAKDHAANGHHLSARSVPVGTLAGILGDAGARQIDILKVDVEGFEEKVLGGNDWERFRPLVVLVEVTYPESPERRPTNIRGFLEQRGYRHVLFDGLNDFYVEHSFPAPEGLTLPPNVFDGFVPREITDLREQVQSLRTHFTSAEAHAHAAQAASVDAHSRLNDLQARYDQALESLAAAQSSLAASQTSLAASQTSLVASQTALAATQTSYEDALKAVDSLAQENRRLGHLESNLTNENRRWRSVADRIRGENTVLNQLLEPLHRAAEQMNQMRQAHDQDLRLVRSDMQREVAEMQRKAAEVQDVLQHRDSEIRQLHASLQAVYASRSWLLTKPWRFAGRVIKRSRGG